MRKYYGKHIGTENVTFSADKGEIFGFVGPNGAGKSTTIKTLMGFIFASSGSASICGLDVQRDTKKIKAFTGYVPSDVRLYGNLKVSELLAWNSRFHRMESDVETKRLCSLFEVDTSKRFSELSTGNKKKVSILCALAPEPKVIILDEPAGGLDPVMQKTMFKELKRRTANGATVLLSSHNLAEVQEYCDRVAFIKEGSILAVTDLNKAAAPHKIITVTGGASAVPEGLELISAEGVQRVFRTALDGRETLHALTQIAPEDFTVENESMEEYFWSLYGQGGEL